MGSIGSGGTSVNHPVSLIQQHGANRSNEHLGFCIAT